MENIEKILNVISVGIFLKGGFIVASLIVLWLSRNILKKYFNNRLCRIVAGILFSISVAVSLIWFLGGLGVFLFLLVGFGVYIPFWFTIVKEGTNKIVIKMGAYHKTLIQWEGKTLDEDDGVIDGDVKHRLGGLRLVGPPPFYTIDHHTFGWTGIKSDGTFEIHPKEEHDYFLLKDDVYGCKFIGIEDRDKIPLDFDLTITAAIVNAKKSRFNVQNWYETMINRLFPYVRDNISNYTYDDLIETDIRLDTIIWDKLVKEGIILEFRDRYGIEIRKIEVRNFDPQSEFRELTLRKLAGEKDAQARTQRITGALMQMIAQVTGKKIEDIQKEIESNPSMKEKFTNMCSKLLVKQMAIDGKAFFKFETNAKGLSADILSLIALFKTALGNNSPASTPDSSELPKGKKEVKDMNREEAIAHLKKKQEDRRQAKKSEAA